MKSFIPKAAFLAVILLSIAAISHNAVETLGLTTASEVVASAGEDQVVFAQVEVSEADENAVPVTFEGGSLWDFIRNNLFELLGSLLVFVEVIVRLTPTEKDNAWFLWLRRIFDATVGNRIREPKSSNEV